MTSSLTSSSSAACFKKAARCRAAVEVERVDVEEDRSGRLLGLAAPARSPSAARSSCSSQAPDPPPPVAERNMTSLACTGLGSRGRRRRDRLGGRSSLAAKGVGRDSRLSFLASSAARRFEHGASTACRPAQASPARRRGALPFPIQTPLRTSTLEALCRRLHLRAYSFASMPCGNCTGSNSMPSAISFSPSAAAAVAGLVAVVGDEHARYHASERRPVVLGKALHAVARRHVAEARAPERQRVDQRFAQDDLLRACKASSFHTPRCGPGRYR